MFERSLRGKDATKESAKGEEKASEEQEKGATKAKDKAKKEDIPNARKEVQKGDGVTIAKQYSRHYILRLRWWKERTQKGSKRTMV